MVAQISIFGRVVDFLSNRPTDEEIMSLKATPEEEDRVDYLSALKNEGIISMEDEEELRNSLLAEYIMGVAKAKAYGRMKRT